MNNSSRSSAASSRPSIKVLAAAELERRRRLRLASLLDFVPLARPGWKRPTHLSRVAAQIEQSASEPVRACCSVPRQFGKTELVLHGFAWLAQRDQSRTHAYITYGAQRAYEISPKIVAALRAVGIQAGGTQDRISLPGGGCIYCTGIDGQLTGKGISGLAVVDDPHKNREEANSATTRGKVHEGYRAVVASGLHPSGSLLVVHTRWHDDDLIARLSLETDADGAPVYDITNLPAISDAGESLWPEERPLAFLQELRARVGEYEWASLFMGRPRPVGASVFRDVRYYSALPARYRVGIGVDLAYTAKTSSDFCVAVVMAADDEGNYYVLDVRRAQADVPTFAGQLRALKAGNPGARMLWYTSTTERGLADLLREETGLPIVGEIATADKFTRAQRVAAAWNDVPETAGRPGRAGCVYLPEGAPWLGPFVSEVCGFTGQGDRHDDQVDALAAAYDLLDRSNVVRLPKATPTKFEAGRGSVGKFQW
jgi:predicted phage terminase large subunit-like protein